MEGIKKILESLVHIGTVSGYEPMAEKYLCGLSGFDKIERDSLGSFVLTKKSLKENAPKVLIDAHLDTVGFMVTEIKEGGFLKVVNVGGLDTRVLPATEVIIYGKKEIYGVVTSTPPHLKKGGNKLPEISELMIDTGYTKDVLCELVELGDPVAYKPRLDCLLNDYVCANSLDDKACCAAAIDAVMNTDKKDLTCDVYLAISAEEEVGKAGPARVAFGVQPDFAIITDVNFARGEGIENYESIESQKGASVSISAVCDRTLTRNIISLLKKENIPHQINCDPSYTGTNNEAISISGIGVRTSVISVPLKSMHTPSEIVSLKDLKSLSNILKAIITTKEEL
ncbi:MAG: M20/M25/M40 family metallo-hydrolase [Clostridia bacterium]|nr:M20/M25/M40 family metallo-hydrolase [Clostridia bacterium]